eukprot:scaffold137811_cov148-Phaeocystis_antarctica.AAC.1
MRFEVRVRDAAHWEGQLVGLGTRMPHTRHLALEGGHGLALERADSSDMGAHEVHRRHDRHDEDERNEPNRDEDGDRDGRLDVAEDGAGHVVLGTATVKPAAVRDDRVTARIELDLVPLRASVCVARPGVLDTKGVQKPTVLRHECTLACGTESEGHRAPGTVMV